LQQVETLVAVIAYKSASETDLLNKHQALKLVAEVMKYWMIWDGCYDWCVGKGLKLCDRSVVVMVFRSRNWRNSDIARLPGRPNSVKIRSRFYPTKTNRALSLHRTP